jgi:anti-sigma factor ChrR (cupin superfamily)
MSSHSGPVAHDRDFMERLHLFAVHALPSDEAVAIEAHASTCAECQRELSALGVVVERLRHWPSAVLPAPTPLWDRLAQRITAGTGHEPAPVARTERDAEPPWEEAGPGIEYKMLATDAATQRVSLLVRLAPGAAYPPHRHAGLEELYLLDGELWIEERKLVPGDYNRAEPGTADQRVWSETGCTCVLLTSAQDLLG